MSSFSIRLHGISPDRDVKWTKWRHNNPKRIAVSPSMTLEELKRRAGSEFGAPEKYVACLTKTAGSDIVVLTGDDVLVRSLVSSDDCVDVNFAESGSIELLFKERRWDDARNRAKRITSPTRVGELLYSAIRDGDVPLEMIEDLLGKLETPSNKERSSYRYSFEYELWHTVCNFRPKTTLPLGSFCKNSPLPLLRLLMLRYEKRFGFTSDNRNIRCAVKEIWFSYLTSGNEEHRPYRFEPCEVSCAKEDEILCVFNMDDMKGNSQLHLLWEKTELLIRLTKPHGLENGSNFPLVHAMIEALLPNVVIWLAMRLYPSQLSMRDREGRIPLHYAAIYNNESDDLDVSFGSLSAVDEKMVKLVLSGFPGGAKYVDSKGRLPLAYLLDLEHRDWTQDCAMSMMKAAPQALITRDAMHHTFPFMTAARIDRQSQPRLSVNSRDECIWVQHSMRGFQLSYLLLRENPAAVAIGITETHFERHLKQKLDNAEAENRELLSRQVNLKKMLDAKEERMRAMESELTTLQLEVAKARALSGEKRNGGISSKESKKARTSEEK